MSSAKPPLLHTPEKKSLPLCTDCGRQFSTTFNLNRHLRNIHIKKKDRIVICDVCKKTCYTKAGFKAHWKSTHSTVIHRPCKTKCPICKHDFTAAKITAHFLADHDIKVEESKHTFQDEESFQSWKKNIENDTGSKLVLRYTRTKQRERKYTCHRSGKYRSASKGIRHLKSQGSKKLDGLCPASMTVIASDEQIRVRYIPTHVGHDVEDDICHIGISQSLREEILKKLKQNISKHTILEDIRNSCGEKIQREHFITLKDIDNIAFKYNISANEGKRVYSPNSVNSTIDNLLNEANSLILFYKPQGTLNKEHGFLSDNDFVLIVMNLAQADVLKNYGNEVICVHGTPGANEGDFSLFSLVILDDLHEAFPCSLMITNREDADMLTFFYNAIKGVVGTISPKIFMSDMADELYDSWVNVMGPVEHRLYCSWYVSKAWRDQLKNIKNLDKRRSLEQYLKRILFELDEDKFVELLSEAVHEFVNDQYYEDFAAYFIDNYSKTARLWAYCYRKNAVINTTNNDIERLHKKMKYLYLKGREAGGIEVSVNLLIKFIRNKLFDRLTVLYKKKVSQKLKTLRSRHTQWKSVQVSSEGDQCDTFLVTSNDKTYRVVRNVTNCKCKMFCSECQSCIHKYLCTCPDNAVEWNMCRHIHAVCQFVNDCIVTTVEFDTIVEDVDPLDDRIAVMDYEYDDEVIICDEIPFIEISDDEAPSPKKKDVSLKEETVSDSALKGVFYEILEKAKSGPERIKFLESMERFRRSLAKQKDSGC